MLKRLSETYWEDNDVKKLSTGAWLYDLSVHDIDVEKVIFRTAERTFQMYQVLAANENQVVVLMTFEKEEDAIAFAQKFVMLINESLIRNLIKMYTPSNQEAKRLYREAMKVSENK